jgi:uncharacterized protein (DUF58 family)
MSVTIPLFLIVLAIVAVFFRADFVLVLTYLLLGVYFIGRWWGKQALKGVTGQRIFPSHVFNGEKIQVRLEVRNAGWLPIIWLQVQESFPLALMAGRRNFREVITLNPKEVFQYEYELEGRRRGIYPIGPLFFSSGDVFGLGQPELRQLDPGYVVVYPRIVPLTQVKLPSNSPLGTLRHFQPLYEDPTRVRGKRDYVTGDSLRKVDWKASAVTGRLQVKLYEPSISLETTIFLNLNSEEYERHARIDATELAIIVAASLASWIVSKKQSVGLITNGIEPLLEDQTDPKNGTQLPYQLPTPIPIRRGHGHLMRILELLARLQSAETIPMVELLRQEIPNLPWGGTLIMITPRLDETFFEGIFNANRAGLKTVLIPCGPVAGIDEIRRRAKYFGIPIHQIFNEKDLDMWRK